LAEKRSWSASKGVSEIKKAAEPQVKRMNLNVPVELQGGNGLGKNTPIITGNSSDSLLALVNGQFTILRVPYPMGFYAKGMDGRFDDPKAGWKGKGVWTTWGTRTPYHSETGKGTNPKVVHFQIRPDPLAD
jgi:hypothetical protein